jgi:alkylation response protein AidB-like acyl-CoA dehydrogenase
MTSLTAVSPVQAVEDIAALVRQHAAEAEETRRLAPPVVEAMIEAGLFRMFVPRAFGGLEASILEGFEAAERLSQIDSAAGWVLQITAIAGPTTLAMLQDEAAREVFADPRVIVAGGFNPPGMAIPVEGGYRLSGRWGFVSGCHYATWFTDPALIIRDGQPEMDEHGQPVMLLAVYPASEGKVIENWDPLGMRGSGSHDVAAQDVFIPHARTAVLAPFEGTGAFAGPLYKLGLLPTILGNAVVALGIARAAIDEAVALTKTRVPAFNQPRPVDRGVVHAHLARAEAELSAARAYFYGALGDAWRTAVDGQRPAMTQRFHLQLAASHAATAAASAVDHVHAAVGSAGVREEQHRFARHFRDVHTITQHALCSPARFESMGQVMLGLETDWMLPWV